MAELEIENQGRHDGQGFSELASDLWDNKPLLIVFAVGLFLLIYALAKNKNGMLAAKQPLPNPAGSSTYLIVNDNQPPPVNVTVNAPEPTSGSGGTPNPPQPPQPKGPPIGRRPPVPPSQPAPPQNKPRTVTVLPWPSQDSTLWGIAQHYGYGANWQVIYNANKSKIGPDPNLLHPGMVLTLP